MTLQEEAKLAFQEKEASRRSTTTQHPPSTHHTHRPGSALYPEPSTVAASQGQDPLLAQYSIKKGERSIGSGAFGQVIIGTRRVDGRNYALKHVDSRDEEWKREYD